MGRVWRYENNTYAPDSDVMTSLTIPPGIFKYVETVSGWKLVLTADRFKFPYKIYGNHDHILHRVRRAWSALEGSLGILLNGVKGTGKTVSAQLLANWAIEQGVPVLVVSEPIPLMAVLDCFERQPLVVLFDEFEKTHAKRSDQQALLTALDGMTRSYSKRMFVFTTNDKSVEENLIDRPSRIRYCWDFARLDETVILAILDDLLLPELAALRCEVLDYLLSRKVLSIDVVKAVVQEVNLFHEPPSAFSDILNLSELEPSGYKLEILNEHRKVLEVLTRHFELSDKVYRRRFAQLFSKHGRDTYVDEVLSNHETWQIYGQDFALDVVGVTSVTGEFHCHIAVPVRDTWYKKYPSAMNRVCNPIWIDRKPGGWTVPEWALKLEQKVELTDQESEGLTGDATDTLYGTGDYQTFLVRATPIFDGPKFPSFGYFADPNLSADDS